MIVPVATPFRAVLTKDQVEGLATPVIPESMEDKWVLYRNKDRVRVHRSWTGYLINEFRLAPTEREGFEGGLEVVETRTAMCPAIDAYWDERPERYGQAMAGYLGWLITAPPPSLADLRRLPSEKIKELQAQGTLTSAVYEKALAEHHREWAPKIQAEYEHHQRDGRVSWWMEKES